MKNYDEESSKESAAVLRVRALHKELLKIIGELREDSRTPKTFKGVLKESYQES